MELIVTRLTDPPALDHAGRAEGTAAWFRTLAATTLQAGEEALLATLVADGAVRSALPLRRARDGALHALTAPYTTRYSPALGSVAAAEALGRRLRPLVASSLQLDALDPADPLLQALGAGLRRGGLVSASYRHFANWYEPVAEFDSFWAARPSWLRETVRRKLGRLERAGRLGFALSDDAAGLERAGPVYELVYAASWKPPEPHPGFMPAMVRMLGAAGCVRLGIASIDGIPAAAQVWLVSGGRATIFKLGHRPEFDRDSPGTLLTYLMARRLIAEERLAEIDFGRGDDAYKRAWLGRCRYRTGLVAANPATWAGLVAAARLVLPTALAALRRSRALPPPAAAKLRPCATW